MSSFHSSSPFKEFILEIITLSDKIEHTSQIRELSSEYGDSERMEDGLISLRDVLSNACKGADAADGTTQSGTLFRATVITKIVEFIDRSQDDPNKQGQGGSSLYERGISEVETLRHLEIFERPKNLMTKFELLKNTDEVISVAEVSELITRTEKRRKKEKEIEEQRRLRLEEERNKRDFDAALQRQRLGRLGHGPKERENIPRSNG